MEQEHQGKIKKLYKKNKKIKKISYGITPRVTNGQKPRIEVFNPVEDNDDQKTPTAILFDNDGSFLAFGSRALQKYAEIVDDGETAMLFQTVRKKNIYLYNFSKKNQKNKKIV